jgi:hypothetical protein
MDSENIQVVEHWEALEKLKDVQAILDLANVYQWFIWNYTSIVQPLTILMKKFVLFC